MQAILRRDIVFEKLFRAFGYEKVDADEAPVVATPVSRPIAVQQTTATDTRNSITYKPTLIAELKEDHRTLLKTFQDIRRAAADRNVEMINQRLAVFKDMLAAHSLKEDLHFYSYTQAYFSRHDDADSAETVHEFRKELRQIAHAVKNFLSRYEGKVDAVNLGNFESDLGVVGEALGKRIGREETILYPLYQP
jgi:hypothetical protein